MSRQREALSWGLVALVLLAAVGAALYVLWPQLQPHTTLRIGDGVFTARVAKTQAEHEKGLSGEQSLREDQAMIFVYGDDAKWAISMKGMKFPVDIVWLDRDRSIVYIVKNAPPESYPYETFAPKQKARYIIQLPAGTVARKSIVIGNVAAFDEYHLQGVKL